MHYRLAIEIPLGPPERSGLVEEIRERQKNIMVHVTSVGQRVKY